MTGSYTGEKGILKEPTTEEKDIDAPELAIESDTDGTEGSSPRFAFGTIRAFLNFKRDILLAIKTAREEIINKIVIMQKELAKELVNSFFDGMANAINAIIKALFTEIIKIIESMQENDTYKIIAKDMQESDIYKIIAKNMQGNDIFKIIAKNKNEIYKIIAKNFSIKPIKVPNGKRKGN